MDTNFDIQAQNGASVRPKWLTILCILTFIGSGFNTLCYLLMAGNLNTITDVLLYSDTYQDLYASVPDMEAAVEKLVSLGAGFFWIQTLLYAASLSGAICMFKRIYAGFHIYTIAQCLLILWSMYRMDWGVPYGSIFLSGGFIALYAIFLPYLKNKPEEAPYDPNATGGNQAL